MVRYSLPFCYFYSFYDLTFLFPHASAYSHSQFSHVFGKSFRYFCPDKNWLIEFVFLFSSSSSSFSSMTLLRMPTSFLATLLLPRCAAAPRRIPLSSLASSPDTLSPPINRIPVWMLLLGCSTTDERRRRNNKGFGLFLDDHHFALWVLLLCRYLLSSGGL